MMAFVYGVLRTFFAALRALASKKHERVKKAYENLEGTFNELETECKTEEVRVGRPVGLTSQIRLLKVYEAKEESRARWIAAAKKLNARKRWEERIVAFHGRKLPYTLGLIDMAVVMQILDYLGLSIDLPRVVSLVQSAL